MLARSRRRRRRVHGCNFISLLYYLLPPAYFLEKRKKKILTSNPLFCYYERSRFTDSESALICGTIKIMYNDPVLGLIVFVNVAEMIG